MEEKIRELIEKWRTQASVKVFDEIYTEILRDCADELEKILRPEEGQ